MSGTSNLTIKRGVHASVTISSADASLVIDPGFFGFPEADVRAAAAVLVTHDHFDHVDLPSLARVLLERPELKVYSPTPLTLSAKQREEFGRDAAASGDGDEPEPQKLAFVAEDEEAAREIAQRLHAHADAAARALEDATILIKQGDEFAAADLSVRVVGEHQAIASVDDPPIPNVGYLVNERVLHPGDARQELTGVETVFTALAAPWQNNPQLEEHLRRVRPQRVIGIHDATLSDLGREFAQHTLAKIAASYGGKAITMNAGDQIELS